MDEPEVTETKRARPPVSAKERCEAVLAVWSERRRPIQVCKEYQVSWAVLRSWEERALKGILEALQSKKSAPRRSSGLSERLDTLLARIETQGSESGSSVESARTSED